MRNLYYNASISLWKLHHIQRCSSVSCNGPVSLTSQALIILSDIKNLGGISVSKQIIGLKSCKLH